MINDGLYQLGVANIFDILMYHIKPYWNGFHGCEEAVQASSLINPYIPHLHHHANPLPPPTISPWLIGVVLCMGIVRLLYLNGSLKETCTSRIFSLSSCSSLFLSRDWVPRSMTFSPSISARGSCDRCASRLSAATLRLVDGGYTSGRRNARDWSIRRLLVLHDRAVAGRYI